jgi:hypothetical protein
MEEFRKSLKAWLYDRTSSPLFFTFVFSWCVWNYKLIIVAFTGNEPLEKLSLIELHLYHNSWEKWGYMLLLPIATTAFMVLVYPILSNATTVVLKKYQNRFALRLLELDNKRPVDEEELRLLRGEFVALQAHFSEMENSKNGEIANLRKTIATLQGQIPAEKKIYPHQDLDDLDKFIIWQLKNYFDKKQPDVAKEPFEAELQKITTQTATRIDVSLKKLQNHGLIAAPFGGIRGERYTLTDTGKALALTIEAPNPKELTVTRHEDRTMTQSESVKQFLSGMQVIEKAIISALKEKNILTDSQKNFQWHRGQPVPPIPTNIELKITLNNGRNKVVAFDREYIEDCHSGIDRPEVKSIIQGIVNDALKQ